MHYEFRLTLTPMIEQVAAHACMTVVLARMSSSKLYCQWDVTRTTDILPIRASAHTGQAGPGLNSSVAAATFKPSEWPCY